ncbi:major facilitator superfamily domain-containing protein [Aspergillus welwitschiae]|uniref:Major facilitator superfamily domain-containing protein n=1 Tax=Aspergillus welwitschiae TaxID=1341132 RepID=A0A3F3QCN7_9EURO|nr:major facilitator superfamily domain-containing protein [Aspergillus welwitschiae]RDH36953.1 major facilitator superfamily domain-containing protein [Aspergillus welwitschiae]
MHSVAGSPGDPKCWSTRLRCAILMNICAYVFIGNLYAAGLATGFAPLAHDLGVEFDTLTGLVAWAVFALGISNLFWKPTAMCIVKRPVILISMIVFLAGCTWSIKATGFRDLLASRIVASFGAGSIEALGPSIIADLFSERYFATAMALFALSLCAGSQIGPMIAGFVIGSKGWRWFFIVCAILGAVNFLASVLFLPETTFRHRLTDVGNVHAGEFEKEAKQRTEHRENENSPRSYWKDLISIRDRGLEPEGLKCWPGQFSLPFRFICVPIVLFATIAYGIFLSGIVLISAISPQFLSAPPYHLSSSAIGVYTLSSFLGIVIGYPIAGPLTDLLSRWAAARRHTTNTTINNTHHPKDRMPALIIPFLVAPPGLILFAYAIASSKSLYVSATGYAMQASALVFVPSVTMSYIMDVYPQSGSEAIVLINAGKNVVAFGVTVSGAGWVDRDGIVRVCWELAAVQWVVLALALPLYIFDAGVRRFAGRFV